MGRDLTPGQRRALTILANNAATIRPPGQPVDRLEISYVVAAALVLHGYARREDELLVITQAGRGALAQPVKDTPRLLAPAARPARTEHGYTHIPGLQMRDDPGEAVSELEQKAITNQAHAIGLATQADQYLRARRDLALAIERMDQVVDQRHRKEIRLMRSRLRMMDRDLKAA